MALNSKSNRLIPTSAVYQMETNLNCVWNKLRNYSPLAERSSLEMVLGAIPTFGRKAVS